MHVRVRARARVRVRVRARACARVRVRVCVCACTQRRMHVDRWRPSLLAGRLRNQDATVRAWAGIRTGGSGGATRRRWRGRKRVCRVRWGTGCSSVTAAPLRCGDVWWMTRLVHWSTRATSSGVMDLCQNSPVDVEHAVYKGEARRPLRGHVEQGPRSLQCIPAAVRSRADLAKSIAPTLQGNSGSRRGPHA